MTRTAALCWMKFLAVATILTANVIDVAVVLGQELPECAPLQIWTFASMRDCSQFRPASVGVIMPDDKCHETEIQVDNTGNGWQRLPGTYSAKCVPNDETTTGYVTFRQSGCTSNDCFVSETSWTPDVCDRDLGSLPSYFSRTDHQYPVINTRRQALCSRIIDPYDSSKQLMFFIVGNCNCRVTETITGSPTFPPSILVTNSPSTLPTFSAPANQPTTEAIIHPIIPETTAPSPQPVSTSLPTESPTTSLPTEKPTNRVTLRPTRRPTSMEPTVEPFILNPTRSPTFRPSKPPTLSPSSIPTAKPSTRAPTVSLTSTPTLSPTLHPTVDQSTFSFAPSKRSNIFPSTTGSPISSPSQPSPVSPTDAPTIFNGIVSVVTGNPSVVTAPSPSSPTSQSTSSPTKIETPSSPSEPTASPTRVPFLETVTPTETRTPTTLTPTLFSTAASELTQNPTLGGTPRLSPEPTIYFEPDSLPTISSTRRTTSPTSIVAWPSPEPTIFSGLGSAPSPGHVASDIPTSSTSINTDGIDPRPDESAVEKDRGDSFINGLENTDAAATDKIVLVSVLVGALGSVLFVAALGFAAITLHQRSAGGPALCLDHSQDDTRSDCAASRDPSLAPDIPPPEGQENVVLTAFVDEVSTLGDTLGSSSSNPRYPSTSAAAFPDEQTLASGIYTTMGSQPLMAANGVKKEAFSV